MEEEEEEEVEEMEEEEEVGIFQETDLDLDVGGL